MATLYDSWLDLIDCSDLDCSPRSITISDTKNIIFDGSTGKVQAVLDDHMTTNSYTMTLSFPTGIVEMIDFSLSIVCGSTSIIYPSVISEFYTFRINSSASISFDKFECSITSCCLDLIYSISPPEVNMTKPFELEGQMVSYVSTNDSYQQDYYVIATTETGQLIQQMIMIQVYLPEPPIFKTKLKYKFT